MHAERRHESCLNCGAPTPGDYCGTCGQRNQDLRASFWDLAVDMLGEAFEADSRMGRTILPFLFKPGFLTNEHNAGRRVRYSSPLRLYLFCSFAFFFVFAFSAASRLTIDGGKKNTGFNVRFQGRDDSPPDAGALANAGRSLDAGTVLDAGFALDAGAALDAGTALDARTVLDAGVATGAGDAGAAAASGGEGTDGGINAEIERRVEARFRRLQALEGERKEEFQQRYQGEFVNTVPKVMFALLPVFALLLKLLFWRTGRYYVEHLTLAFHVHSFAFLALLVPLLVTRRLATAAALIVVAIYLLAALRTVYRLGWGGTIARFFALSFVYLVALSVGIAVAAFIGLFTA